MFWIKPIKKFSKDSVMQNMVDRIKLNAEKEWVSIDEYYKIRESRKNKVLSRPNNLRKKGSLIWSIWINKVYDYWKVKGWLIEIWTNDKSFILKAYVNSIWRKPVLLWEMDWMTFAEKNKIRRTVYWYFDNLQES